MRSVKRHAGDRIILGSGDLFDAAACLAMLRATGVDGVSIARGAIGNPWIFQQVQALARGETPPVPDLAEQARVLRMHCELAVEAEGESAAAGTMRMFGIKFARLHPDPEAVRNAFSRTRSLVDWHGVLETWYARSTDVPEMGLERNS